MDPYHYILTIETYWYDKPNGAYTLKGVFTSPEPLTREQVLERLLPTAIDELKKKQRGRDHTGVTINFFSLEKNNM